MVRPLFHHENLVPVAILLSSHFVGWVEGTKPNKTNIDDECPVIFSVIHALHPTSSA